MKVPAPRRAVLAALMLATWAALGGCSSWGSWSNGTEVSWGARADHVDDSRRNVVEQAVAANGVVRIGHLAGSITLVQADVEAVELHADVHARGADDAETDALLAAMTFVQRPDTEGRSEWTLAWPTNQPVLHYSTGNGDFDGRGFKVKSTRWAPGRTVTVTTQTAPGVPTLYADLTITYPAHVKLHVRGMASELRAGALSGNLHASIHAGAARIESFDGDLFVDTGSGDITLGDATGTVHLDTGSGDIVARRLAAKAHLDTGSGSVRVDEIEGSGHIDTGSGDIHLGLVDGTLHADTGSGDITVEDLRATAHLDTGSGSIVVERADADSIRAGTGSGRIIVRGGRADVLDASTGSGGIEVHDVEFVRFGGDTGSGNVTVRSSLAGAERLHVDTGSGRVVILTGDDASFDIQTDLSSGRLDVGFDDAERRYSGKRLVGARRGGGHTAIHVDTGSGDCVIKPAS